MSYFISVIVPIYNVERYLSKCISSLINQTYDNYEIILVNDGSPDSCGEICDRFAKENDRIKVLHLENGGVCNARNQGMLLAKGDFFCFVDSDDWVEPHYIEDFAKGIEDEYTMVVQDACRDIDDDSQRNFFGFDNDAFILKSDFAKMIDKNILYAPGGYPWNKLYSRKIIFDHQLKFDPEIKLGDDEKWNLEYFKYVKKVVFSKRPNYHYIYNPNSISNQKRPFERELLRYIFRVDYYNFVLNNYDKRNENLPILISFAEEFFRINIFDRIYKGKLNRKERLDRLREISKLPKNYLFFLQSKLRFRNLDYTLLKKGNILFMDLIKMVRLSLNR
ncbi:glycosyltransferase family 2 protein [Riemerella anatipestifer]|uniref:glycosyltransferase family 2 protein n=1 Tax=Riemerella anatipestifer TaxID=34085 RepID=UPI0030C65796